MNATSYSSPGTTGGNREDLRGPLTILEPEETPFTSMCRKGPAPHATLVEHGADRLRAPRLSGTREGLSGPKGGNKAAKRQRFGSYLHRWHDTFGVTDVQQLISEKGGVAFTGDEYGLAKAKCVREIKRDMEAVNCSNQDGANGDDEMRSRGAFKWMATSQTPAVPAQFQTPAGQAITGQASMKESGASSLNAVLKSIKAQVGGPKEYNVILGNDYQENADNFTRTEGATAGQRYQVIEMADLHEITMIVKVFNSSFGRCNFIPSEFVNVTAAGAPNTTAALVLNMDFWEMLFLDELHAQDDEPDAGGSNGFVKAIGGLFCLEPRSSGFIANALN